MRAVTCHEGALAVAEIDEIRPGRGQVLLDVVRCGICGSDLHARRHCDELADVLVEAGYDDFMRSSQRVVFGHEFSGRVAEYGPGSRREVPEGGAVVALPLLRRDGRSHSTGLSVHAPGAYAERILVEEALMLPVPNGLAPETAAMTEPLAIAWHAVRRSEIGKRDTAVVVGCGPIGLAVILMLKARGVRHVVASDLSPARRALATRCGADVVVDPERDGSPLGVPGGTRPVATIRDAVDLAIDSTVKLRRIPVVPWYEVWRLAERLGQATPPRPIVFECVGVPGMIDSLLSQVPMFTRVMVVGVCMGADRIRPSMAINKEIDLRFVLGYTPLEFRDTLHMLADGKVDPAPLLTGEVGLAGVEAAFDALGDPDTHAKILIDPRSEAAAPAAVRA